MFSFISRLLGGPKRAAPPAPEPSPNSPQPDAPWSKPRAATGTEQRDGPDSVIAALERRHGELDPRLIALLGGRRDAASAPAPVNAVRANAADYADPFIEDTTDYDDEAAEDTTDYDLMMAQNPYAQRPTGQAPLMTAREAYAQREDTTDYDRDVAFAQAADDRTSVQQNARTMAAILEHRRAPPRRPPSLHSLDEADVRSPALVRDSVILGLVLARRTPNPFTKR